MPSIRRIASVALALALVAGPAGALCAACCPETKAEMAESIGAAMPCCEEDCAPAVSGPKSSTPAAVGPRSAVGAPLALVMAAANFLDSGAVAGMLSVFRSPSPPPDIGPASSVLRL